MASHRHPPLHIYIAPSTPRPTGWCAIRWCGISSSFVFRRSGRVYDLAAGMYDRRNFGRAAAGPSRTGLVHGNFVVRGGRHRLTNAPDSQSPSLAKPFSAFAARSRPRSVRTTEAFAGAKGRPRSSFRRSGRGKAPAGSPASWPSRPTEMRQPATCRSISRVVKCCCALHARPFVAIAGRTTASYDRPAYAIRRTSMQQAVRRPPWQRAKPGQGERVVKLAYRNLFHARLSLFVPGGDRLLGGLIAVQVVSTIARSQNRRQLADRGDLGLPYGTRASTIRLPRGQVGAPSCPRRHRQREDWWPGFVAWRGPRQGTTAARWSAPTQHQHRAPLGHRHRRIRGLPRLPPWRSIEPLRGSRHQAVGDRAEINGTS